MTDSIQFSQALRAWMEISTHRSMHERSRFAKSTGLSMPQLGILMQLHHKGRCGVSEIGERFDISNAAASQLVEKLVQAGYLERTEDPNDRRVKQLTLTTKAEKLIESSAQKRYRWLDELTSQLSAEEQTKAAEALAILTKAAQKLEDRN
ncbi:putative HTH-type transcriptional regulator YusO [Anaerolineales bacterium]|nr:putative HTH-type transcriptional regulator YusO [Anaerolineales bacterium]